MSELFYRTRAVNTATESENKIHDDRVAAQYGFRGGLVPGVTVYGYMAVPLVEHVPDWLERGWMNVRFLAPVYDGDEVVVRGAVAADGSIQLNVEERAIATAAIQASVTPPTEHYPEKPLPKTRPAPSLDNLIPGTVLGSVVEKLDLVEPRAVLQLSNEMLVRNFNLGPWIHVGSEIQNYCAVRSGDEISARGLIHERFERKGHEFVVIDVMLITNGDRLAQTVRHTAIYKPRNT